MLLFHAEIKIIKNHRFAKVNSQYKKICHLKSIIFLNSVFKKKYVTLVLFLIDFLKVTLSLFVKHFF